VTPFSAYTVHTKFSEDILIGGGDAYKTEFDTTLLGVGILLPVLISYFRHVSYYATFLYVTMQNFSHMTYW